MGAWFGREGLLARVIPGYEDRPGQLPLAEGMVDALEAGEPFIAEAGTGIGKSASYLASVIASGKTALISTYTKALQDQLGGKDLPMFQSLAPGLKAVVLKGRRNYLCLLEWDKANERVRQGKLDFSDLSYGRAFELLRQWLYTREAQEAAGDLDQLPFTLPDEIRGLVTVDGQSCIGRKCSFYSECYSQLAKIAAEAAQVVIVNHRLLLLDMALSVSTQGEASILPSKDLVILDEAHHLENVAAESFGGELSEGRWRFIERRVQRLGGELIDRLERQRKLAELEHTVFRGPAIEQVGRVMALATTVRQQAEAWCDGLLQALGEKKSQELRLLLTPALRGDGKEQCKIPVLNL